MIQSPSPIARYLALASAAAQAGRHPEAALLRRKAQVLTEVCPAR